LAELINLSKLDLRILIVSLCKNGILKQRFSHNNNLLCDVDPVKDWVLPCGELEGTGEGPNVISLQLHKNSYSDIGVLLVLAFSL